MVQSSFGLRSKKSILLWTIPYYVTIHLRSNTNNILSLVSNLLDTGYMGNRPTSLLTTITISCFTNQLSLNKVNLPTVKTLNM